MPTTSGANEDPPLRSRRPGRKREPTRAWRSLDNQPQRSRPALDFGDGNRLSESTADVVFGLPIFRPGEDTFGFADFDQSAFEKECRAIAAS